LHKRKTCCIVGASEIELLLAQPLFASFEMSDKDSDDEPLFDDNDPEEDAGDDDDERPELTQDQLKVPTRPSIRDGLQS